MKINNTATKKQIMFSIISIVVIIAIVIAVILTRPEKKLSPEIHVEGSLSGFAITMRDTIEQFEKQSEMDENILTELHSGTYSFENPLVIVNPYEASPLTALAIFTSDESLNISIHIEGKTELANVDYTFDGYKKEHIIPIYGLYADTKNNVTLTARNESGQEYHMGLDIITEPLPQNLDDEIILTDLSKPDKYQDGFNFVYLEKKAFDVNGDYRWVFPKSRHYAANYYYNGWIIDPKGTLHEGETLFFVRNILGRIDRVLYSPYGVHHDIEIFGEDKILVTGSYGETVEDFIYELNMETGTIDATLDLKKVLQRNRDFITSAENPDWAHHNKTTWEPGTDKIIISVRQQGVVKLSWPEGKIDWILSNHDTWLPMFQKNLISPLESENDFDWFYKQHCPVILPDYDNDPDTIDILLFDNGTNRYDNDEELQRQIRNNEVVPPELYSRLVQYRINEKNKTVEQIRQFGKEYGDLLFSHFRGSSYLLPNGNWHGTFEGTRTTSNFVTCLELSEDDIIWEAFCTSKRENGVFEAYRIERLPIYNESANDLKIGTPAKNLIPQEILKKYGYS